MKVSFALALALALDFDEGHRVPDPRVQTPSFSSIRINVHQGLRGKYMVTDSPGMSEHDV